MYLYSTSGYYFLTSCYFKFKKNNSVGLGKIQKFKKSASHNIIPIILGTAVPFRGTQ